MYTEIHLLSYKTAMLLKCHHLFLSDCQWKRMWSSSHTASTRLHRHKQLKLHSVTRSGCTASASRVTSCQPCSMSAQVLASLLSDEQRRRTGVLHSVWAHRVRYGSSTGVSHHSPPAEMHPNPPPSTGTPPQVLHVACLKTECVFVRQSVAGHCRLMLSLLVFPDKEQLPKSECSPC